MKESKNYPLYEVTPVNSIRELLDIAEAEVPEKIAFKYRVKDDIIKEIKYAEFIRDVNAVGSALCELGVVGEHIAQIGENSYRWINVYLTVLAGNGVYIPVDKDLPDGDIINILKHSDASVLFYSSKFDDFVQKYAASELADIHYFIRICNNEEIADEIPEYFGTNPRFLSFEKLKEHGYELLDNGYDEYLKRHSEPYDLKMIVYTSGTTGLAKGVMLCEHNLVSIVY